MQTIIRLPQAPEDLKSAGITTFVIDQLSFSLDFTEELLKAFAEHKNISDFILNCKEQNEIYYVKTFPDNEPYSSDEVREYICYGEYHRNLMPGHKNILFRIDQPWDTFQFPQFGQDKITVAFKKYVQLLSGTVSETIFPAVYLDQNELNDKSNFSGHHFPDRSLLNSLYLFSTDYWGNAAFLDSKGNLIEFKNKKGTLLKSDLDLISWTENKLKNFFESQANV